MTRYLADFEYAIPFEGKTKNAVDFIIDADSVGEAKKQLKEWFEILGDIRIIKQG